MSAEEAASPAATVLVCVTCKSEEGPAGVALYGALAARLVDEDIALSPVECLSVCKRPCTVALAAPGKWTYVVGDLEPRGQCRGHRDRGPALCRRARRPRSVARTSASLPQRRHFAHAAARSRSSTIGSADARQDPRHHRHRLSRRRQDHADPPSPQPRRRPAPRAHHQRIRRRRRRRRAAEGLRRRRLPREAIIELANGCIAAPSPATSLPR